MSPSLWLSSYDWVTIFKAGVQIEFKGFEKVGFQLLFCIFLFMLFPDFVYCFLFMIYPVYCFDPWFFLRTTTISVLAVRSPAVFFGGKNISQLWWLQPLKSKRLHGQCCFGGNFRANAAVAIQSWYCYLELNLGGGFKYFCFQPYLRKIPFLTKIFHRGWFNHQLGTTHTILRTCIFTYIKTIKIHEMKVNVPVSWMVWVG